MLVAGAIVLVAVVLSTFLVASASQRATPYKFMKGAGYVCTGVKVETLSKKPVPDRSFRYFVMAGDFDAVAAAALRELTAARGWKGSVSKPDSPSHVGEFHRGWEYVGLYLMPARPEIGRKEACVGVIVCAPATTFDRIAAYLCGDLHNYHDKIQ